MRVSPRWRWTKTKNHPIRTPMRIPPMDTPTNWTLASSREKAPVSTAATANL